MPTLPTRALMRRRAIESFLAQQVPEDWEVTLSTDEHPTKSLGEKLNRLVQQSRADFFVLLDDDDWHAPHRVFDQVSPLYDGLADLTGTSVIYYLDERRGSAHWCLYLYKGDGDWLGGLAFTRAIWEKCHFLDKTAGVDYLWQKHCRGKSLDLLNPNLFVAGIHDRNTCKKDTSGSYWLPVPAQSLPEAFLRSRFADGGLIQSNRAYLVGQGSGCGVA